MAFQKVQSIPRNWLQLPNSFLKKSGEIKCFSRTQAFHFCVSELSQSNLFQVLRCVERVKNYSPLNFLNFKNELLG